MLTNGRITCFNSVSRPTRSRRLFSLRGSFVSYVGRNMLFYPIPQSLGFNKLRARLSDLAYAYSGSPIDHSDFLLHREHFQALKSLRANNDIFITKPDKGSGVVILNKKDYINKMEVILHDKEKFAKLGDVETHDKTAKLERKLQKRLLELVNSKMLATEIYDRIRPTGSQRPQMYGLPKIHKPNVPLRPILSMIGSAQHELAKWLSEVLDPVLQKYSKHCIKDSFTFAEFMQNLIIENETSFMCSFDISSLFTNVPLSETIKICADALYRSELNSPPFPEEVFIELMETATRSVEFSFNNEMYQQKDGVAMGSPLGPALANIFVGFHEERLFDYDQKPGVYFRYVDDTYTIFKTEAECDIFLKHLNSLHPALQFTFEKEENDSLPFLDVLVEKSNTGFLTSVYRKPTFTGQYIRWNSFCPKQRKVNLVKTLVHRALMICSKSKLHAELEKLKTIFLDNGYPEDVILSYTKEKIASFSAVQKFGPQKCPVYLKLPWIGNTSLRFESQIRQAITNCFFAVNPRIVYSTRRALPSIQKDCVPTKQKSSVIYEFTCQCDSGYVGRTTQRLGDRIKQHVPSNIRNKTAPQREQPPRSCRSRNTVKTSDSAIGQHLLDNPDCAKLYNDDMFRIIGRARSSFHLAVLESIYIKTKKPPLCRQKEFVFSLGLHW